MDNMRRAICFETPDYIPMNFVINPSCWEAYPQDAIFELVESHSLLFPGFRRPAGRYVPEYPLVARKGADFTDDFGCAPPSTASPAQWCGTRWRIGRRLPLTGGRIRRSAWASARWIGRPRGRGWRPKRLPGACPPAPCVTATRSCSYAICGAMKT